MASEEAQSCLRSTAGPAPPAHAAQLTPSTARGAFPGPPSRPPVPAGERTLVLAADSEKVEFCLGRVECPASPIDERQPVRWNAAELSHGATADQGLPGSTAADALLCIAEEEADCMLRATTRRAASASAGNRLSPQAGPKSRRRKPKEDAALFEEAAHGTSSSPVEQRSNESALPGAVQGSCEDMARSAACQTPAPRRHLRLQDDVEMDGADVADSAPTPILPMTARRKGRFAAMQTSEVR